MKRSISKRKVRPWVHASPPSYANLFIGFYEGNYIQNTHPWSSHIKLYRRYIDDLFFVWEGTESGYLNQNEFGIKLTGTISPHSIDYLDITLTMENSTIISKTHFKEVDTYSLLHFRSAHYKRWLTNVPYGQFCRLRKNCTRDQDFDTQAATMAERPQKRRQKDSRTSFASNPKP